MARVKQPPQLRICHMPSQQYPGPHTPKPECPECGAVRVNLRKNEYSACPNGHGGLFTPVVEVGKWRPVSNDAVQAAANQGRLLSGSVPNMAVKEPQRGGKKTRTA